ncbi:hypothetical protein RND71_023449 [Anisodus tanguticus]|uniref:Uncharacterized protein n=1 Tax=Anisodus tanguticus TaxID=243964 RepID=A0AAE1RSL9_9SOLA|nr:hypothetical protein RND71_023449 [Anisodus tanguticus]
MGLVDRPLTPSRSNLSNFYSTMYNEQLLTAGTGLLTYPRRKMNGTLPHQRMLPTFLATLLKDRSQCPKTGYDSTLLNLTEKFKN